MRKLVLVVDDNDTSLLAATEALKDMCDVMTVNSGKRALELVAVKPPDLILTDVSMPFMDGFELLRILKSQDSTKHIPVICLTGLMELDNEYEGLALGAVDYIMKPVRKQILRKRVENHLLLAEYAKQGASLEST